jgi:hypothetical protein
MAPSTFVAQRSAGTVAPAKEDLSGTIIACAGTMIALSTLAVALRFYVRGRMVRTIASEDWCILAAWVFTVAADGGTIREAQLALGHHIEDVSPENLMAWLHADESTTAPQTTFIKTLFYNLSLFLTKVSVLLLYLRVLKTYNYLRKAIWATLVVVIVYNVWAVAMQLSTCVPLRKKWDRTVEGYCHPLDVWWALTYIHIITDFIIFLLPIPAVVSMTIPRAQKAGLLFVFCIGLFVCLISVLRVIWLTGRFPKTDMTWHLTSIGNWSSIEINIFVICACLTTLKPLFEKFGRPCIDRLSPGRKELEDGSGIRPPTIGSSPLQAMRGLFLHSLGHTTAAETDYRATVNEVQTSDTTTLGKMDSSDSQDMYDKSAFSQVSQVTTSEESDIEKLAAPKEAQVREKEDSKFGN